MKTSLAVCLALVGFLSSNVGIRGVGALKCYEGYKCEGCNKHKEGTNVTSQVCADIPNPECGKLTAKPLGKEGKISVYLCIPKKSCQLLRDKLEREKSETSHEGYKCYACDTDNCNSALRSAPGLGPTMLLFMAAAVVSSILFGM